MGTLVCGYLAIQETLRGVGLAIPPLGADPSLAAFDNAAKAIGWAIVFDGLDGRIARLTNSSSDFGREFDSLADVITFGVAPALLAYAWGVRPIQEVYGLDIVQRLPRIGWVVAFAFVICGAARLARFNIDKGSTADRRYFVGMPIPGAAGVIAAIVHWAEYPINDWRYGLIWLVIVGTLAFLMVSRVRYYSFKALDLRQRRRFVSIIAIGLVAFSIYAFSRYALLTIALIYAFSGPLARLTSKIRPQPPAPEEVHAA